VPNRLTELVQYLVRKNRGASRNMPPPGLSDNSVLVSAFFTLLRILRPYLEGRSPGLSTFPAGLMFLQARRLSSPLTTSNTSTRFKTSTRLCWHFVSAPPIVLEAGHAPLHVYVW